MKIRIIVVDDHTIMRDGLKSMLSRESDMEVVADTGDGRSAIDLARQLKPAVVLLDISMPEMNGIEAARRILSASRTTKVICLSMHSESRFVKAMLEAGAKGYVLKDDVTKELIEAIRRVALGGVYLSPAVAGGIVSNLATESKARSRHVFEKLSDREREVLQLIAEGYSTKEAASRLNVSEKTVSAHREHIMAKLGIHNVVDLTRYALKEGITEL